MNTGFTDFTYKSLEQIRGISCNPRWRDSLKKQKSFYIPMINILQKFGKEKEVSYMPRYLVSIFGKDNVAMADLVRKHRIGILRETLKRLDEQGGYRVDALVDSQQIPSLEAKEYRVEIREAVEEIGMTRQAEVGKGNRYLRSVTVGRD